MSMRHYWGEAIQRAWKDFWGFLWGFMGAEIKKSAATTVAKILTVVVLGGVSIPAVASGGWLWGVGGVVLRHERLAVLCAALAVPELALADGVFGTGRVFFAAATTAGHEGVVAKRLNSSYRPGRRSAAWRKIKPREPRDVTKRLP
jgi:hypothetical protein